MDTRRGEERRGGRRRYRRRRKRRRRCRRRWRRSGVLGRKGGQKEQREGEWQEQQRDRQGALVNEAGVYVLAIPHTVTSGNDRFFCTHSKTQSPLSLV